MKEITEKEVKIQPAQLYPLLQKVYRILTIIKLQDLDESSPQLLGWMEKQLDKCKDEVTRLKDELTDDWVSHLEQ